MEVATRLGRALVTGGAGLIGSHVVDRLITDADELGVDEVVILDDFSRGRPANIAGSVDDPRVTVVEADVRDPDAVRAAMEGIETVFHLAAIRITHCAVDPRLAYDVLGGGSLNVAEAARDVGVSKVVLSSSASVYGLADEFPTHESHHRYGNRSLYGALKTFNEDLFRSYKDMFDLDYVGLRYFNVYGPRMDVHGKYTEVLIRWMERLTEGQPPAIFGDGTHTMDFVHAVDIARANVLAAVAPATDQIYNIGSGTEVSLSELAVALGRAMKIEIAPEFGPERSVNAVPRRLADVSAAARDLGWKAEIDLDSGLVDLVDWWRAERQSSTTP